MAQEIQKQDKTELHTCAAQSVQPVQGWHSRGSSPVGLDLAIPYHTHTHYITPSTSNNVTSNSALNCTAQMQTSRDSLAQNKNTHHQLHIMQYTSEWW